MTKVSVVVPAYCPGSGINRAVKSLDRQTMSTDDFELIVVDDGSPDDTWSRLEKLAATRPWMQIERIENSGWPSRPRNVGTDLATGEYVVYLDHDDEIFPDGLRAAYDYACEHGADVLSGKESKTNDITFGLGNFTSDVPNAKLTRGIDALLPMMPHKLYRTAFLREHGIRFPEGRRMLWEDIYFNVAVFRHARVISILSSTPFYLWVETKKNNSATYGPQIEEFWVKLTALLRFIHDELPGDDLAEARAPALAHQLSSRVVGRFYNALAAKDRSWVPMAQSYLTTILAELTPTSLDHRPSILVRLRLRLLRDNRIDLLDELRSHEGTWVGQNRADRVSWDDQGRLLIESTTRWTDKFGRPLTLWRSRGRLLRALPQAVTAAVPIELIDVTNAVPGAKSQITLRDREANITWTVPSESVVQLEPVTPPPLLADTAPIDDPDAEPVTVVIRSTVAIDVGPNRRDTVWDVHARNTMYGYSNHRAVLTEEVPTPSVCDGRVVQVLRSPEGKLSIEILPGTTGVAALFVPTVDQVLVSRRSRDLIVTAVIPGAGLVGQPVEGTLRLVPCEDVVRRVSRSYKVSKVPIVGRAMQQQMDIAAPVRLSPVWDATGRRGMQISASVRVLPGSYDLSFDTGGSPVPWPVRLRVGALGRADLAPVS